MHSGMSWDILFHSSVHSVHSVHTGIITTVLNHFKGGSRDRGAAYFAPMPPK